MADETKLEGLIRQAFDAALVGYGLQWEDLVRSLGVTPLAPEQRAVILKAGVPLQKGVLPVELRVVLEAIRAQLTREPEAAASAPELRTFVDRELRRYLAAARPRPVVRGSRFAASTVPRTPADEAIALECGCCGVVRPAGSELSSCTFCGNALL